MAKSTNQDTSDLQERAQLRRQVNDLTEEVSQLQLQNEALQNLVANLQIESMTDDLTEAHNRRFFDREVARRLAELSVTGKSFCLLLADVDQLKTINDRSGHLLGDKVLQNIARQLLSCIPSDSSLSRLGGDEFAIILPMTNREGGQAMLDKMQAMAESTQHTSEAAATLSFGIAEAVPSDTTLSLFDRADRALYEAKNAKPAKG